MNESVTINEELEQTAAALEQILEAMPGDLFTLRALFETCLKLQQPEKAMETLYRLDDAARAAQNAETIRFVLGQYESVAEEVPDIRRRMQRLEELQMVTELREDDDRPVQTAPSTGKNELEAEMKLAWELFQDEQITQEEYSGILSDLTEMSAGQVMVPVTVLHILHDRNFSRFERLMTHLCQKSGVPILTISLYDENEELQGILPVEFMMHHAAMPFAKVGEDLQLAVLNPFDQDLVKQVSELTGCRCHPFLVTPQEYDRRLAVLKEQAA